MSHRQTTSDEAGFAARTVVGVDFSGGAMAGLNIWLARATVGPKRLRLVSLDRLADLAGDPSRDVALRKLVQLITSSRETLWGIDFPFGLPIELTEMGSTWRRQVAFLAKFAGGAPEFGRWCVQQALAVGNKLHIRRLSDVETKTPFDCYHYRIIYQTFHGMRDVLATLARTNVAILPFQYDRLAGAPAVVVEACPSSTLKRLQLPHQNYKQPSGGPLEKKRLQTRLTILSRLETLISISDKHRSIMLQNPGGDALDATLAAIGTWQGFAAADHTAIAHHPRYPREGRVYA